MVFSDIGRRCHHWSVEITIDDRPPTDDVRRLFREYAGSLSFELDFQDFEREVAELPGPYAPPHGALLLARVDGDPAGCVGVRSLRDGAGELKRLYVRDRHRGLGIGRRLTEEAIVAARSLGYASLRLDTTPEMTAAQALYGTLGFREIVPYRHNPIAGARYLELDLTGPAAR